MLTAKAAVVTAHVMAAGTPHRRRLAASRAADPARSGYTPACGYPALSGSACSPPGPTAALLAGGLLLCIRDALCSAEQTAARPTVASQRASAMRGRSPSSTSVTWKTLPSDDWRKVTSACGLTRDWSR